MLFIVQLAVAICALGLGIVRLVESIYQLRQKKELDTLQKCWQVLKNFFTIETYTKK